MPNRFRPFSIGLLSVLHFDSPQSIHGWSSIQSSQFILRIFYEETQDVKSSREPTTFKEVAFLFLRDTQAGRSKR